MHREGRVLGQELDRLFAGPAEIVHARVDDQPAGPPHFHREPAEVAVGIFVETGFQAQSFGIEGPAFDKGGEIAEPAKRRHAVEFLLQRQLQVMARHGFVEGKRFEIVERPTLEVVGVHVNRNRPWCRRRWAADSRRPLCAGRHTRGLRECRTESAAACRTELAIGRRSL